MLAEYYPQIKATHIALVLASGALLALRAALLLSGTARALQPPLRHTSYIIDTALLAAALLLLGILHLNPFTTPWLATKLGVLLAYITLGAYALKRARTPSGRYAALAGAAACYVAMYGIARTHHPLGYMLRLLP